MPESFTQPECRVRLDFRAHGEHAGHAVRSDLSGVAAAGCCLWVASDELATVERLTRRDDGSYAGHEIVHLAAIFDLPEDAEGDSLDKELQDDVHIARFVGVPAKENGFDIEGIAASGDRVFLGLRGPVLRGWALLLELQVKEPRCGRLKLRTVGPDGARYVKRFLDLAGLGIRELAFDGEALGPTMDLDGPVVLDRWPGALAANGRTVVPADQLERVSNLPYGRGVDHAEGLCWLSTAGAAPGDAASDLLVVYDSPADDRLHDGAAIDADMFRLDGRGAARQPRKRPSGRS